MSATAQKRLLAKQPKLPFPSTILSNVLEKIRLRTEWQSSRYQESNYSPANWIGNELKSGSYYARVTKSRGSAIMEDDKMSYEVL